jgi:hypothetical protein
VRFPRTPLAAGLLQLHSVLQAGDTKTAGNDRLTVGVAARLSRYLQVLTQSKKMGKDRISSKELSDYTNINATQIRRDLSAFGSSASGASATTSIRCSARSGRSCGRRASTTSP